MNIVKCSAVRQFGNQSNILKIRSFFRDSTVCSKEVQIPDRIERSPTDILRAISGTVSTDFTAPHYRYHDDPWLVPYTQNEKREFALARESGKNAARFILENHPHLFTKNRILAEPPVTAFQPRAKYNRDNVTVELLENMISSFQVSDAISVYELLLEKKKVQIPDGLLQGLLELLAFNSEEEALSLENKEPKYFLPGNKSWKSGGLAETLYSKLGTSEARVAMLLGFARHGQVARTMQVWEEMKVNQDKIPLEAFNAYLSALNIEDVNKLKVEITDILTSMKAQKLQPNHETLVSCLRAVSMAGSKQKANYSSCCEFALCLLAEFRTAGVEPSLGAFCHLLDIFYSKISRERPMIIKDFLNYLEDKDMWPARSEQDFLFFKRAMEVCQHLNQTKLAYRLHSFLLSHNNQNLLGNFRDSERYYELLVALVLRTEDLETALELYNKLAPHTYSPRKDFYIKLLSEIQAKGAVQHLGKIFDDLELCSYGGCNKEGIYEMNSTILRCMDSNPPSTSEFNNLSPTYVNIANRIFKHLELNKASDSLYLRFNTHAAGICTLAVKVLLKEAQFPSALEIFNFCLEEKERMPGQLGDSALTMLLDAAIEEENIEVGLQIVDYLLSVGSSKARSCGEKLGKQDLSSKHSATLNKYFAHHPKWSNI
ncbi:protein PTCD3 homolog, mitochondrial [Eurytemora carolleeae]|uniref:protein PTCD3 homolog, mitochondrial n=1 Tax=Eurytemora carolleeae TaxID=1294199 RepID=UPI000C7796B8|nr:protein PTCD3 homolog, mitochondrial [Eurytemora carolleeae]|eukprot:XP_023319844.1 protein PTCD3 homolog, mitochondrial-like [Eurytemora affinis]